ncbi:MAG: hypothetical protein C0154_16895 [Mucilaginibacter sp.]|nr:MAG: hypothetical protein BGO48_14130 [Mucilaginibacter sp. 44-25]PLW88390.1 MAG: hypothetical protein C0154_16895 [Mucilaginibacter sp.]
MNTGDKHYKFINSRTGYVIFYTSLNKDLDKDQIQAELEKIKEQVAVKNGLYHGTVYWEEIKEEN